ncbi:PSD1 and planctomycete cytochrome C domain-containing protein [Bremerella sp. P1]|uniref:PSD1 and planctomycete cytochrome C domain-containing protein n=1 Tax=Bremerella sp. P1 TaxID=3026424 RepID=UPI002368D6F2|nr:PSD1 and planctomycete cytochrome C domain-containing protein [Bremerella sp. P1]WDI41534.1 PSD1 and planctomycete cytochrome C domain-containing protein [Bremerella sp. P1]
MIRSLPILLLVLLPTKLWADDFFLSKIEPILRTHCYECHSHDESLEGGLALDSRSGWEQGGDSGAAVIASKPDESLLIQKVRWSDEEHRMPPEEKLAAADIALLEKWVEQGAPDPRVLDAPKSDPLDWWSLKPLHPPLVPIGGANPIDAFVASKLKDNGLEPSAEADRRTLARRLYLDLYGMLPTPEEVDAFENDPDPQAWERLVDKLLDSPRYGERWARHWLDVIHYADSHGCEHDVKRPNAWRFRDYVIERLNADVPWERFIREQLAADVFYPDQPQLTPALGFISAGPLELSRASTAPVTFDYLDRDDIVTQTMAAFASTTANCARCHTHKFDPITQEDYYSLQAVFAGVGKGDIEFDTSSEVMHRRQETEALLAAVHAKDATVLLRPAYAPIVDQWTERWEERQAKPVEWKPLEADVFLSAGGATLTKQDDNSIFVDGTLADQEQYTVTSAVNLKRITAVRLDVLKDERHPQGGPGRADNGNLHLSEVEMQWFAAGATTPVKLKIAQASADFDQVGWTSAQAIDGDLKSGWAIHPRVSESHVIVFEFAEPIDAEQGGKLAITLKQLYPPKHVIGRFRLSITDAEGTSARILPEEVRQALKKPADQRTPAEKIEIAAIALEPYANETIAKLPTKQLVYGVSPLWSYAEKQEKPIQPKVVHLLKRGDIDKPIREVGPGAISAINPLPARFELADPKQESLRRAALADWLAHPDNPLTWRSIVNRVWHYHFGRGICETPNDFGRMGGEPSHPEMLDWLAVWFRDDAQGSLRKLHRLILTSKTWKQASVIDPMPAHAIQVDRDNRLLWRMNRVRLDADAIRDSTLRISGRLDLTMGGEGVEQFTKTKGPQATPVLDYTKYDWNSDSAARRSIYRVVWRGIPDPFMESLDFPDLGLLTPKRNFSVSALQSLTLYNNDFILHASTWIADRVKREMPEDQQIRRAVELCWQRAPTVTEEKAFQSYAQSHGLEALCRVLLNSNEYLFVD